MLKILQARLQQYLSTSAVLELSNYRCASWILKGQRNQRSNWQHPLDHRESKRIPGKSSASLTSLKPLTVWITTNWKILKEMGIPDHLPCLLRNQQASQESIVITNREQQTVSKLEKEYVKAVYCHSAFLTSMQSTSCKMPGWMNHKLE